MDKQGSIKVQSGDVELSPEDGIVVRTILILAQQKAIRVAAALAGMDPEKLALLMDDQLVVCRPLPPPPSPPAKVE